MKKDSFSLIKNNNKETLRPTSTHNLTSDKSLEEITDFVSELERQGRAKVTRVSNIKDLAKLPDSELSSTERRAVFLYRNRTN